MKWCYFDKKAKKYHVRIYLGIVNSRPKYFHIGRTSDYQEAIRMYNKAVREMLPQEVASV